MLLSKSGMPDPQTTLTGRCKEYMWISLNIYTEQYGTLFHDHWHVVLFLHENVCWLVIIFYPSKLTCLDIISGQVDMLLSLSLIRTSWYVVIFYQAKWTCDTLSHQSTCYNIPSGQFDINYWVFTKKYHGIPIEKYYFSNWILSITSSDIKMYNA
jgi:hypothetical protein